MAGYEGKEPRFNRVCGFLGATGATLASMVVMVGCSSADVQNASAPQAASARVAPFAVPIRPADILTKSAQSRIVELQASFSRPSDPGPGVAPIRPREAGLIRVKRNAQVPLGVFAPPGTSVIFRTTGGGKFEGGSTIVEVKADQDGTATAVFRATEDARGYVDMSAMSPQLSGKATFTVEIQR